MIRAIATTAVTSSHVPGTRSYYEQEWWYFLYQVCVLPWTIISLSATSRWSRIPTHPGYYNDSWCIHQLPANLVVLLLGKQERPTILVESINWQRLLKQFVLLRHPFYYILESNITFFGSRWKWKVGEIHFFGRNPSAPHDKMGKGSHWRIDAGPIRRSSPFVVP